MIVFDKKELLQAYFKSVDIKSAGFVPTMGALHQGHLLLVKESLSLTEKTVVSIFVNPTQFNNPEDLKKYPRTLEADIELLNALNDQIIVYAPEVEDIYPSGTHASMPLALPAFEQLWEGSFRPGHFAGVAQVVEKLLLAVHPTHLFMGQKDFQQCMVVNFLLEQRFPHIKLHIIPTLREKTGLAMSSRNTRLNSSELQMATVLHSEMKRVRSLAVEGRLTNPEALLNALSLSRDKIMEAGFSSIDYLSVCSQEDLTEKNGILSDEEAVILVAATLSGVRLIDNMLLPLDHSFING